MRKDWSLKLHEALCAYWTTYKTLIGMTHFKLIYEKLCHLPVELEHKAYWAIKALNFNMQKTVRKRCYNCIKLEELRHAAYENASSTRRRPKTSRRNFHIGEWMLLFNSRLKFFSRKLRSRWTGPYQVPEVFDHGVVEI
jgi:hypothetical protein